MATRKLYQILASHLNAMENCKERGNAEWLENHTDMVLELVKEHMPSGGGFDSGTILDFDASKGGDKLVFQTSFHHMSEHGYYDGWSEHIVTIKPSLQFGFDLKVSGRDRNDIKDYIAECFHSHLSLELEPDTETGSYKLAA